MTPSMPRGGMLGREDLMGEELAQLHQTRARWMGQWAYETERPRPIRREKQRRRVFHGGRGKETP